MNFIGKMFGKLGNLVSGSSKPDHQKDLIESSGHDSAPATVDQAPVSTMLSTREEHVDLASASPTPLSSEPPPDIAYSRAEEAFTSKPEPDEQLESKLTEDLQSSNEVIDDEPGKIGSHFEDISAPETAPEQSITESDTAVIDATVSAEKPAAVSGEKNESNAASPAIAPEDPITEAEEPVVAAPIIPKSGAGSFVINDTEIKVFDSAGVLVYSRSGGALIFNAGLSPSGELLAIQTSNGLTEEHSMLTLVDLKEDRVLYSVHPKTRWADSYKFNEETKMLTVVLDYIGDYRYSADGESLDTRFFNNPRLDSEVLSICVPAAEEKVMNGVRDRAEAQLALDAAIRAMSLGADKNQDWFPRVLRVKGLAYEALGDFRHALACLDKASRLSPKIKVKNKLKSLRQKLGLTP
jgi:hypothetical protein